MNGTTTTSSTSPRIPPATAASAAPVSPARWVSLKLWSRLVLRLQRGEVADLAGHARPRHPTGTSLAQPWC